MQVLSDNKEWRNRLTQTKSHQVVVAKMGPETHSSLERIAEELEKTLDAIKKAEAKLNAQCTQEIAEFAEKQEDYNQKQEDYNKNTEYVNRLTSELASISEELTTVKAKIDERVNSMTDTSPLIN